jgi:hypothetical protein
VSSRETVGGCAICGRPSFSYTTADVCMDHGRREIYSLAVEIAALRALVGELVETLEECGDVGHAVGCCYDSEDNCDADLCGLNALIARAKAALKEKP